MYLKIGFWVADNIDFSVYLNSYVHLSSLKIGSFGSLLSVLQSKMRF